MFTRAAMTKSLRCRPPMACVHQSTVTLPHSMTIRGWWSASLASAATSFAKSTAGSQPLNAEGAAQPLHVLEFDDVPMWGFGKQGGLVSLRDHRCAGSARFAAFRCEVHWEGLLETVWALSLGPIVGDGNKRSVVAVQVTGCVFAPAETPKRSKRPERRGFFLRTVIAGSHDGSAGRDGVGVDGRAPVTKRAQ